MEEVFGLWHGEVPTPKKIICTGDQFAKYIISRLDLKMPVFHDISDAEVLPTHEGAAIDVTGFVQHDR